MPKGKKRNPKNKGKPQNKGSTKKRKHARYGFAISGTNRRKIDMINKKLSEFYNVFGEYSPQYQKYKKVVLTQLGVYNPQSSSFDDYFTSRSPLRLSTDTAFLDLLSAGTLDELHKAFKGRTAFKEAKKIEGFKNITRQEFEQRKSEIKYDTTVKGLQRLKDFELQELISYLPQFYTALDQMDTSTSEEFTKRFSEYGVIKKTEEPDKKKSEGERLINDILKYFDGKVNEGNLIKNARKVLSQTEEPSIYEQLARHQPVKLKFADDDSDGDDDVDWSNVKI